MYRLKQKFDRILVKGYGIQLLWLFGISAACLVIAVIVAHVILDRPPSWQHILAMFMDPGNFLLEGEGDVVFRLVVTFLGLFLFTALFVSVLTNVMSNIQESVQQGERRYGLSGHILILGGGNQLQHILNALKGTGKTIVVMSTEKVSAEGKYIFYRGRRDVEEDLRSARADKADCIYIIGEDNEAAHDALSLTSLELLEGICNGGSHHIHCYITVDRQSTSEIFFYTRRPEKTSSLLVDVINRYEYMAEQLMVDGDFLPVLRQGDVRTPHIIIIGNGGMAKAAAYTAAHICHYPVYAERGVRTRITMIADDVKRTQDEMVASRPELFRLSHYSYISPEGEVTAHTPEDKDFQDIEWRFVDNYAESQLSRKVVTAALASDCATSIIVCDERTAVATDTVLHLPRECYDKAKVAIYLNEDSNIIEKACATGMYGNIRVFGPASGAGNDPLFTNRNKRGQQVNFIYDQAYSKPASKDVIEAWYKISEANKFSSIYCANAFPLRMKCYDMDGDRMPVYEAEHRRWMMSTLIMGYVAGEKSDKQHFIHSCIVPFDDLPKDEQEKDSLLMDNMKMI